MRRLLSKIDNSLERWLIVTCYGYFCLIILVEVVRRHALGSSSVWGEMTARYAFVFLVYFAVAEVARTRSHIRIDLVPRLLGPKGQLILYAYFDLLYSLLAALVIYYSLQVIGISLEYDRLMIGLDLNMAFAQAALPIGWALLAYRVAQSFYRTWDNYRKERTVPLGGGLDSE